MWRDYERFVAELTRAFPHEAAGIRGFYGECWKVSTAHRRPTNAAPPCAACSGRRALTAEPALPPACPRRAAPPRTQVFNALNSLELKSLEEPRYLLQQFARAPGACLTLASYLATNAGDVARKHIKVPPRTARFSIPSVRRARGLPAACALAQRPTPAGRPAPFARRTRSCCGSSTSSATAGAPCRRTSRP